MLIISNIAKCYSYLITLFFIAFTSLASSQISYTDHCSSFVPEPTQHEMLTSFLSPVPFPRQHTGYYFTKTSPPSSRLVTLQQTRVYETGVPSLFRVEANLVLESEHFTYRPRYYYSIPANPNGNGTFPRSRVSSATLSLQGFWSELSGKMCLVGGVRPQHRDELFSFPVSLKLFNLRNSSNLTDLVAGTLESLLTSDRGNPNYFTPISVMLFVKSRKYEYTLVSQEIQRNGILGDEPLGLELFLYKPKIILRTFLRPLQSLELKYSERCTNSRIAEKCSPLGDSVDHLPGGLQVRRIEISYDTPMKMRILMRFPKRAKEIWHDKTFDANTTLVGDGIWDMDKNRLFVVACRFFNATESWAEASIGNCSMRLSLRFPAVWSLRRSSSVVGRIWSDKSEGDSGFFDEISFRSSDRILANSMGVKYEYTELEKVKKWWSENRPRPNESARKAYPEVYSYDMRFDVFGQSEEREILRGYAKPFTVGNRLFGSLWYEGAYSKWNPESAEAREEKVKHLTTFNTSYEIGLTLIPKQSLANDSAESWDISAEGIYDALTGMLCLVGCRDIEPNNFGLLSKNSSIDCEILIRIQFPPKYGSKSSGFIKGIIESKRRKTDPLYFAPLRVASAAFVASEARKAIWEADFEIIMGIVSNAISCVFIAFQLFHLRRNPDTAPLVSLAMLVTLAFGYITSLVINLKSMMVSSVETRDMLLEGSGWVEAKGVTQGVSGFILNLLMARLIQRVWRERISESTDQVTSPCVAEKEAVLVSLPLYFGAAFLSMFFAWKTKKHDPIVLSSEFMANYSENPIWVALKSYADVISDGFLVPQSLLNVFIDSHQQTLALPFFVGMTLVRVLPRVYGLCKAQSSVPKLVSVFWDVIVCLVSLLLALIVFLQQKFGGRCVLPLRLKRSNGYEKVISVGETNET